jgi:hypothetical protein
MFLLLLSLPAGMKAGGSSRDLSIKCPCAVGTTACAMRNDCTSLLLLLLPPLLLLLLLLLMLLAGVEGGSIGSSSDLWDKCLLRRPSNACA